MDNIFFIYEKYPENGIQVVIIVNQLVISTVYNEGGGESITETFQSKEA